MKVDDTRDGAGAGRRTGRFCGSSRQALHRFHTEMVSVAFVAEYNSEKSGKSLSLFSVLVSGTGVSHTRPHQACATEHHGFADQFTGRSPSPHTRCCCSVRHVHLP